MCSTCTKSCGLSCSIPYKHNGLQGTIVRPASNAQEQGQGRATAGLGSAGNFDKCRTLVRNLGPTCPCAEQSGAGHVTERGRADSGADSWHVKLQLPTCRV